MQNTVAVISLKNIVNNARKIIETAGVPLIAVVKDDAYGHGAEKVANALFDTVSSFAVASVDEGAALKIAGISKDVLVLTPPLCEDEVIRTAGYGLVATVSSLSVLRLCVRAVQKYRLYLRVHFAVNTGMNRYGFRPERMRSACREALAAGIAVEGVYSHFYCAEDGNARAEQLSLFDGACAAVREYFPDCTRHISATGGAIAGVRYDAFRAGIALYGYLPSGFEHTIPLKPAMKIYATVAQSGALLGGGMGYARAKKRNCKVQTLRLGYGDGFFRTGGLGADVLCMDACVREGAGRTGDRRLVLANVSGYAKEHGTTEYEVLVNIARKAVKFYE